MRKGLALTRAGSVAAGRVQAPSSTPPVYRASTHNNGAGVTSRSLTVPESVVAGDVMLIAVAWYQAGGYTTTPPAGWTLVREDARVPNVPIVQTIYRRVAQAGEAGTVYTWTFNANNWTALTLIAYSGGNPTTPVNTHGANNGGSTTSLPSAALTTTVDNTTVVEFFTAYALSSPDGGTMAGPATVRETSILNDMEMITADQAQVAAGATPVRTATVATNNAGYSWIVTSLALTPA